MTSTVHNTLKTTVLLILTYITGLIFFRALNMFGTLIISTPPFALFIIQFGYGMAVISILIATVISIL